VLILGGRSSNFPEWVRKHSRVVIWFNTDPAAWRKDTIPERVEVIIHTRFIAHKMSERVKKNLPEGVRYISASVNTGNIKNVLAAFGIAKPPFAKEKSAAEKVSDEWGGEEEYEGKLGRAKEIVSAILVLLGELRGLVSKIDARVSRIGDNVSKMDASVSRIGKAIDQMHRSHANGGRTRLAN
jgi:hypothetical protein